MLHISGTIHMIINYGAHMYNDDIPRHCFHFFFFNFDIFLAVSEVKGQKIVQNENGNYICYVPFLRNSVAYDHDFWYTCVK